jgi:hypothetical protein
LFYNQDSNAEEETSGNQDFCKPLQRYNEDIPEGLCTGLYSTKEIPRLFALCHCKQMATKLRILKAVKLRYSVAMATTSVFDKIELMQEENSQKMLKYSTR